MRSLHRIDDGCELLTKVATFETEFQRLKAELEQCQAESQSIDDESREGRERYRARMLQIMTVRSSTQRRNARVRLLKAERKTVHQRLVDRIERHSTKFEDLKATINDLDQRCGDWKAVIKRAYQRGVAQGLNDPDPKTSTQETVALIFTDEERAQLFPAEPSTPPASQSPISLFTPPAALGQSTTEPTTLNIFDKLQATTTEMDQLENENIPLNHQSREESALSSILGSRGTAR